ncbi:MAG: nucleotidyltransferase family protein [Candidatus Hydrogenedentes bacterium]|nr:nucleotidyltransferase family protein [Candidatus Hydrogenedentota bacterium]
MTLQLEQLPMDIAADQLAAFCQKWRVRELALFGSVLRSDFRPDSDVDVLVTFADGAPWSLWDWGDMMDELKSILGRNVDLVEKDAIQNPYRRESILREHRVIYTRTIQ